jgi:DNA ligase-1
VIRFAALYDAIDASTGTQAKTDALAEYFANAPAADAAWAVAFLTGRRPKRLVRAPDLRTWAAELANIPDWLFEESYAQVGDLAETIALLIPENTVPSARAVDLSLAAWVEQRLLPLRTLAPAEQRTQLFAAWNTLRGTARFVYNKLLTGAFRVGVSDGLVVRALARTSGVDVDVIAHRLMGQWEPLATWFDTLVSTATSDADWSRPYPFFLAYPLEAAPETLGAPQSWQIEYKWDGIRAQLIVRRGKVFLWSRGEELLNGRFPEVEAALALLPDGTVLDGELLAWQDARPMPFTALQRRLNRKTVGKKLLSDVPVHLVAYDCLELEGRDIRGEPMRERRKALEHVHEQLTAKHAERGVTPLTVSLSPLINVASWDEVSERRSEARAQEAEGLMLKRADSPYGVGRKSGEWWKWKVSPLSVDAVLVYAQAGHGRRSGLYTDYTFAVWLDNTLVPFAKAYSGLTDAEIREVDRFVRANTKEKFGPVRTVEPRLVFELAFEGIQESTRHKSGLAVRFPRIARWRRDKVAADADSLETVRAMLRAQRNET